MAVHFYEFVRERIHLRGKFFQASNATERSTYCDGMVKSVSERLREIYMYKQQEMGSESTALVRTQQGVDNFTNQVFPKLRKIHTPAPKGTRDAYMLGRQHGNEIPLSRPVSDGGGSDRGKIK